MTSITKCSIVSAEEELFSGSVVWITVMSSQGELGIKPGHAPLLADIKPGPAHLTKEDGEEIVLYLSGGYIEVLPQEVTILADTALRTQDIDEMAVEKARDNAMKNLLTKKDAVDYSYALSELTEAAAQLRTLRELRKYRR